MKKKFPIVFLTITLLLLFASSFGQSSDKRTVDSTSISDLRLNALLDYYNDKNNIKALWTFAETSEYLADYDLAVKAYGVLISKLKSPKDKINISKARAHQITCSFLQKSIKEIEKVESQNVGLEFKFIDGHIFVKQFHFSTNLSMISLKACDEIKFINQIDVSKKDLNYEKLTKLLKGNNTLKVKRFNETKLVEVKINISPIKEDSVTKTMEYRKDSRNSDQQNSQSFLKEFIVKMQQDTFISKSIEHLKRINYALIILNKWAHEPVNSKNLIQINEQLGMISALYNTIVRANPTFTISKNGSVYSENRGLQELPNNNYSQQLKNEFDLIAQKQDIKETKIDDRISFVETRSNSNISGKYACAEILDNSNKFSITNNPYECEIPGKVYPSKYKGKTEGESVVYPLIVEVRGENIKITTSSKHTDYGSEIIGTKRFSTETITNVEGKITGNEFILRGKSETKFTENPQNWKDSDQITEAMFTVKIETVDQIIIKQEYKTNSVGHNNYVYRLTRYKKL